MLEPSLGESSLYEKLQWLKDHGYLPVSDMDKYDLFRQWRNRVAHPKAHTLVGPPDARHMLREMRDFLEYLFADTQEVSGANSGVSELDRQAKLSASR